MKKNTRNVSGYTFMDMLIVHALIVAITAIIVFTIYSICFAGI